MLKNTAIIILVIVIIYLYYQQRKTFLTGHSSNSEQTIRDLTTQLQQAQQLEKFNSQQLTRLQEQLKTYQQGEDWESKTDEIITNLEAEVKDLTTERDTAIREQKTSEQEIISLSNRLKLKNSETTNKDQEIQRLRKEKSEAEIRLNKSLTELKEKYSKQGKLLDEEQTDNNKLTNKIESLEEEIKKLTQEKTKLPGEWDYSEELETQLKEKDQQIAELEKQLATAQTGAKEVPLPYLLGDFIDWIDDRDTKIFKKVDWDYYRERESDWIKEFQNWNRLQPKRIELLKKWQLEVKQKNNHD